MAFTLRVTQGAGEGEEFSFDSGEARLGRTADNDVVIKDPSSSRSHARVYEERGKHFVEDLKSANGTTLNDAPLKGVKGLKSGDLIAIGDVVLEFSAPAAAAAPPDSTMDESSDGGGEDPGATMERAPSRVPSRPQARPVPSRPARPSAPKRPAPAPPPEPEETGSEGDEEPPADEPQEDEEAESTRNYDAAPAKALQRRPSVSAPARPSRSAEAEPPAQLSAADRARQRRELQRSTSGRAQLLWSDLSKPVRIVVGLLGAVATLALLGGLGYSLMPKKVQRRAETETLVANAEPLEESFGEGDGVDFSRPDMKSFTFNYASPTAIVGVLHYQARDASKDEVSIELNGSQLGFVPPDTVDANDRRLDLVLPSNLLKVGEDNELVFDNVNNPPGEDPWRVWNVWVEVIPIPQMSAEDAGRRAKEDLEKASKLYELRGVGAMNLFRSWKQYRDAWLLLEATPDRPADLLLLARTRMREIGPELDQKCKAMLMDYKKVMSQRDPNIEAARKILQNIPSHFEKEHYCFGVSRALMRDLDELGETPTE